MMEIISDPKLMKIRSTELKRAGKTIGLVPTMGALHDGHLSLIDIAKSSSDMVVMSIFLNPLQFGIGEDLTRYPSDIDRDIKLAQKKGVDVLFCPTNKAMYPGNFQTYVETTEVSKGLCGTSRPTHFKGVSTIVLKLFNIIAPDISVFGQKDYQQLKVIEKMVSDLNLDIRIISAPIVREKDGLAMSSRNQYLRDPEREAAASIYKGLTCAKEMVLRGERDTGQIIARVRQIIESTKIGRIDYVKICEPDTLKEQKSLEAPALLAIAAFFGPTRLIDNCLLTAK